MNSLAFFDTNVLVYTDDASSPEKQAKATFLFTEHLRQGSAVVSLQVLQEYFVAITRKLGVNAELAQRKVEVISGTNVVRFQEADVIASIELHRLTHLSFWDTMILHAARTAGAQVLYSEDFQHGAVMAGVKVVNPFLAQQK
jgi:predicted nucleic acid-binding protein